MQIRRIVGIWMVAWCALTVALPCVAAAPRMQNVYTAVVKGLGTVSVQSDGTVSQFDISIAYPNGGPLKNGVQRDEHTYISYSSRVHATKAGQLDKLPKATTYEKTVVWINCKAAGISNLEYYLLPSFHNSQGLYCHKEVEASMPTWRKIYASGEERIYFFQFVPDTVNNDGMLIYLEGNLLGKVPGVRAIRGVQKKSGNVEVRVARGQQRDTGMHELMMKPFRCHPLLADHASLSVGAGQQVIEGIPMMVWSPSRSFDQGRHHKTSPHRDLVWDPLMERTCWSIGPEYMLWNIPGRSWRYAYVLCADIPEAGKEATVGTQFMKLGRGCTSGNINFEKTDLKDPAFAARIKTVGTLTYQKDGQTVETPLYLVRQPLDIAKLGSRGENKLFLNFEFVGSGTWEGFKRSSVQIFGCTLQEAPYTFQVNNPVRGNIFEEEKERYSLIDLRAAEDDVEGTMSYEVIDPLFKVLKKETVPFQIAKRGERKQLKVDFSEFGRGWYGLTYEFRDKKGAVLSKHPAAFTVLATDDREAGYESPFAAWPLLNGYHNSNPNPKEQLEVMRKAGYRKAWYPPLDSEAECAPWKVTRSSIGLGYLNPGNPSKTRADFDKRMDAAVKAFREEFRKFPHCQVIQLLHEQGGRGIADEVTGEEKPVRGAYRGWDFDTPGLDNKARGDWEVFYCTEYAKRMRKEFPGKRIMIGNGSSSSEKVASLVRRGFDLALVDELGIESKGFGSMPEFNANRESPGMLWALRETGRLFGYTHLKLNACNEYVFRPERNVKPDASRRSIMEVADYAVRDYLLSLGHGCDIISHGHLEDCNDAYYDTNWGASGQCKFYPYSYPKRMYTALAVMTRALDKPVYQRRVPTGELTAYALEFLRDRKVQDYAYALWTPHYYVDLCMKFPKGTAVRLIENFGKEHELPLDGKGMVVVKMGGSPCYVIASRPVEAAQVVGHDAPEIPAGSKVIGRLNAKELSIAPKKWNAYFGNGWEVPDPLYGHFVLKNVVDEDSKKHALEVALVKDGEVPPVMWEYTKLDMDKPIRLDRDDIDYLGILVKGNGAFQQVMLLVRGVKPDGKNFSPTIRIQLGSDRSYAAFNGWQCMMNQFSNEKSGYLKGCKKIEIVGVVCGSARKALDPIEMADVTEELRLGDLIMTPKKAPVVQTLEAPDAMGNVEDKDW